MPGSKQAWPNSAACWSPAMPLTGTASPAAASGSVTPKRPLLGPHLGQARLAGRRTGRTARRTTRARRCRRASCGSRSTGRSRARRRRAAGEAPEQPGVDGAEREVGVGLDAALGRAATRASSRRSTGRARARSRARISGSCPASRSASQSAAVRRSCHTIARCSGRPVRAVPHDDGLALVGDADRTRSVSPAASAARRDLGEGLDRDAPRSRRRRARPSPAAGSAAGTRGTTRARGPGRARRPRACGRRSCPRRCARTTAIRAAAVSGPRSRRRRSSPALAVARRRPGRRRAGTRARARRLRSRSRSAAGSIGANGADVATTVDRGEHARRATRSSGRRAAARRRVKAGHREQQPPVGEPDEVRAGGPGRASGDLRHAGTRSRRTPLTSSGSSIARRRPRRVLELSFERSPCAGYPGRTRLRQDGQARDGIGGDACASEC